MEEWKPITGYEGIYEVSTMGRVCSVSFNNTGRRGMLSPRKYPSGYVMVALYKDKKRKNYRIHQLVWDHFGNRARILNRLDIDHINNIKTDNRLDNLQLLTNRENCSKRWQQSGKTLPTGVCYHKTKKKFIVRIQVGRKLIHLGYCKDPDIASDIYQKALKVITEAGAQSK